MASNLTNQARNVLSKKLLGGEEVIFLFSSPWLVIQYILLLYNRWYINNNSLVMQEAMDDINLFSVITILSFLLSCPLMLLAEGVKFSPAYLKSTVSVCKIQANRYLDCCVIAPKLWTYQMVYNLLLACRALTSKNSVWEQHWLVFASMGIRRWAFSFSLAPERSCFDDAWCVTRPILFVVYNGRSRTWSWPEYHPSPTLSPIVWSVWLSSCRLFSSSEPQFHLSMH